LSSNFRFRGINAFTLVAVFDSYWRLSLLLLASPSRGNFLFVGRLLLGSAGIFGVLIFGEHLFLKLLHLVSQSQFLLVLLSLSLDFFRFVLGRGLSLMLFVGLTHFVSNGEKYIGNVCCQSFSVLLYFFMRFGLVGDLKRLFLGQLYLLHYWLCFQGLLCQQLLLVSNSVNQAID
jgi:hypothetical protein